MPTTSGVGSPTKPTVGCMVSTTGVPSGSTVTVIVFVSATVDAIVPVVTPFVAKMFRFRRGAEQLLVNHAAARRDRSISYEAVHLVPWKNHLVEPLTDLGVAVDTPQGLVVPVIRNADELTVRGLARAVDCLKRFRFSEEDAAYLSTLRGNDGEALYQWNTNQAEFPSWTKLGSATRNVLRNAIGLVASIQT